MPGYSTGSMIVSRRRRFVGSDGVFRVIIDGEERARLRSGDEAQVEVAAGSHEVYVTTDGRVRSAAVTIEVAPGDEVRVLTSSPANPIANLLNIAFRPAQTLEIERR